MIARAVTSLMIGILLVIKPDAFKRPFGDKSYINLNPEAAPTKSYIRLMRGIGIAGIVVGVWVILRQFKIL